MQRSIPGSESQYQTRGTSQVIRVVFYDYRSTVQKGKFNINDIDLPFSHSPLGVAFAVEISYSDTVLDTLE
jgi:hypothetical protein